MYPLKETRQTTATRNQRPSLFWRKIKIFGARKGRRRRRALQAALDARHKA
jgi:hypothetical protein